MEEAKLMNKYGGALKGRTGGNLLLNKKMKQQRVRACVLYILQSHSFMQICRNSSTVETIKWASRRLCRARCRASRRRPIRRWILSFMRRHRHNAVPLRNHSRPLRMDLVSLLIDWRLIDLWTVDRFSVNWFIDGGLLIVIFRRHDGNSPSGHSPAAQVVDHLPDGSIEALPDTSSSACTW